MEKAVRADPRAWIAQRTVSLSTSPTWVDGQLVPRHVDLRPFAVNDGENDLGHARWADPGGAARGGPRRQLVPGRWLQGHLGGRRHAAGPPVNAADARSSPRRRGRRWTRARWRKPSTSSSSSNNNNNSSSSRGATVTQRPPEPGGRVDLLGGSLRRARRRHCADSRRCRLPGTGAVERRGERGCCPTPARRHGHARRRATRVSGR